MKMLAASGGSRLPLGDVVAGQLLTQALERNTTVSDLSQPSGLCWQRTLPPSLLLGSLKSAAEKRKLCNSSDMRPASLEGQCRVAWTPPAASLGDFWEKSLLPLFLTPLLRSSQEAVQLQHLSKPSFLLLMEPESCWIMLKEPWRPYRGPVCPFSPCCWLQVLPFSYQDLAQPGARRLKPTPEPCVHPAQRWGQRETEQARSSAQELRYQPRAKAAGGQRDVSPAGMVTP